MCAWLTVEQSRQALGYEALSRVSGCERSLALVALSWLGECSEDVLTSGVDVPLTACSTVSAGIGGSGMPSQPKGCDRILAVVSLFRLSVRPEQELPFGLDVSLSP